MPLIHNRCPHCDEEGENSDRSGDNTELFECTTPTEKCRVVVFSKYYA